MITKVGYYSKALLAAGLGGYRNMDTTAEEEAALKQHYGLDPDASLGWRNAGRGVAGGVIGGMAGRMLGRLGASDLKRAQNEYLAATGNGRIATALRSAGEVHGENVAAQKQYQADLADAKKKRKAEAKKIQNGQKVRTRTEWPKQSFWDRHPILRQPVNALRTGWRYNLNRMAAKNPYVAVAAKMLPSIGSVAGTGIGSMIATNKYSKGNAQQVMAQQPGNQQAQLTYNPTQQLGYYQY